MWVVVFPYDVACNDISSAWQSSSNYGESESGDVRITTIILKLFFRLMLT